MGSFFVVFKSFELLFRPCPLPERFSGGTDALLPCKFLVGGDLPRRGRVEPESWNDNVGK